jgi:uncharacterized membrane protein
MLFHLKIYAAMLVCFFAIDLVWLGLIASSFYKKQLDFLLRPTPNWPIAIAFYLIFIAGMLVFVVSPSLQVGSWKRAVLLGAFFGLVTYATYDLTNHATVKGWPWIVSVVDRCWGSLLSASVCTVGYFAGKWFS